MLTIAMLMYGVVNEFMKIMNVRSFSKTSIPPTEKLSVTIKPNVS